MNEEQNLNKEGRFCLTSALSSQPWWLHQGWTPTPSKLVSICFGVFCRQSANYDFYLTLEAGCCGTLQHIDMPAFKPSSSQVMAAAAASSPSTKLAVKEVQREGGEGTGGDGKDLAAGMSALSLALSLGEWVGCSPRVNCHTTLFPWPEKKKTETRMTASILKQDPNTWKVQKNVLAKFWGNSFYQATKHHLTVKRWETMKNEMES